MSLTSTHLVIGKLITVQVPPLTIFLGKILGPLAYLPSEVASVTIDKIIAPKLLYYNYLGKSV